MNRITDFFSKHLHPQAKTLPTSKVRIQTATTTPKEGQMFTADQANQAVTRIQAAQGTAIVTELNSAYAQGISDEQTALAAKQTAAASSGQAVVAAPQLAPDGNPLIQVSQAMVDKMVADQKSADTTADTKVLNDATAKMQATIDGLNAQLVTLNAKTKEVADLKAGLATLTSALNAMNSVINADENPTPVTPAAPAVSASASTSTQAPSPTP